ncbi:type II toxin-antitoxin system VapC family toxin [Catenuloplanes sp. NPDC051500]|uniref:type II toxin-antitoxin system VapC family toxin n=1 Tax=Catenuloplanes sp. NPDC051500 TaxID=3363959 RepID=UPI00378D0186
MIVPDTSAITTAVAYSDGRGDKARMVLLQDDNWIAPEHWHVEVIAAIHSLVFRDRLSEAQGLEAIALTVRMRMETVPIDSLIPRMWRMRTHISAYDAAYVALAEQRDSALVTADAELARIAPAYCRVEVV